jgi:signal peptidase I
MSRDWEDDNTPKDDPFTSPFREDAPPSDGPAIPEDDPNEPTAPEDDLHTWPVVEAEDEEEDGSPEEPFEWPTPYSAGYSAGPPYAEERPRPYWDQDRPPSVPQHRSRDPLARLFPGLPRNVRVTLDWILTIVGAILIVLALKEWVVNPYRIPSSSMEPALNCAKPATGCLGDSSDRVLACRICLDFGPPSRGDIVVFNTPKLARNGCGEGGTFVKRVIGLPGETLREDDSGFIWIRGPDSKTWEKLKEPYLSAQRRLQDSAHFGQGPWHVPEGQYFMMGDNRAQSCDSRTWGSVPRDKLIGTVFFVYWPPDRIGFR